MRILKDIQQGKDSSARHMLLLVMIASMLATFMGLLDVGIGDGSWVATVIAFLAALAGAYVMFKFWRVAFASLNEYKSIRALYLSLGLVIAFIPAILAFSTYFAAAYSAGNEAMRLEVQEIITQSEITTEHVFRNVQAVKQILPDLLLEQERFARDAKEEKLGMRSGSKGTGTIYRTLLAMSERLGTLHDALEPAIPASEVNIKLAQEHIQDMRIIAAKDNKTSQEKLALMGAAYDDLRVVIIDMAQGSPVGVLDRSLKSIIEETGTRKPDARTPVGRINQERTLEAIKVDFQELHKRLMADFEGQYELNLEPLKIINPATAVWRYKSSLVPYIALPMGLDLSPLIIYLFLFVGAVTRSLKSRINDEMNNLTIGEVIRAGIARQAASRADFNPEKVDALTANAVGEDELENDKGDDE